MIKSIEDIKEIKKELFEKRKPLGLHIDLTYRCNVNCKHCYLQDSNQKKEMNSNKIKDIIKQAKKLGCLKIGFSGGEIFLRKDILDLIKFVSNLKLISVVRTNGLLINDYIIKELSKIPLIKEVIISLYGFDSKSHDEITNKKGSFKKTMSNIKKLLKAKVPLVIQFVATHNKVRYLPKIKNFCDKNNINLYHTPCLFPCIKGDKKPLSLNITKDEFYNHLDNFEIVQPKKLKFNKLLNCYVCKGGLTQYYVSPSGELYPCTRWGEKLGNLNKENLSQIIKKNRKLFKPIKFKDRKECLNCRYIQYCEFCPAEAKSERGKANLPYKNACYWAKIRCEYFKERRWKKWKK